MIRDLQKLPDYCKDRTPLPLKPVILAGYGLVVLACGWLGLQLVTTEQLKWQSQKATREVALIEERTKIAKERETIYKNEIEYEKAAAALLADNIRPDGLLLWVPNLVNQRQQIRTLTLDRTNGLHLAAIIEISELDKIPDAKEFNRQLLAGDLFPAPEGFAFSPAILNTTVTPQDAGMRTTRGELYSINLQLKPSEPSPEKKNAEAAVRTAPAETATTAETPAKSLKQRINPAFK